MENKQTAVEWLLLRISIAGVSQGTGLYLDELLDQAKQMEKDQIQQAWIDGMKSVSIAPFEDEFYKYEAEAYYDKMRELG